MSIGAGAREESLRFIEQLGVRNILIDSRTAMSDEEYQQRRRSSPGLTDRDVRILQANIDADAIGIALGDHGAVMHHNYRLGSSKRRRRGLLEGMIECGFQSGIGRLDKGCAGNLRQQRWTFWRLQRVDVALEKVGFIGSVQEDAAEPVMKRGTATVSREELLRAIEQTPPSTRPH